MMQGPAEAPRYYGRSARGAGMFGRVAFNSGIFGRVAFNSGIFGRVAFNSGIFRELLPFILAETERPEKTAF